jgi:hypothetical protein
VQCDSGSGAGGNSCGSDGGSESGSGNGEETAGGHLQKFELTGAMMGLGLLQASRAGPVVARSPVLACCLLAAGTSTGDPLEDMLLCPHNSISPVFPCRAAPFLASA